MTRPPYNGPGKDNFFLLQGRRPRGVIHVGINDGEEIPWYLIAGYWPILGFEPNPEVFEQTYEDFTPEINQNRVFLYNLALGNPSDDEIIEGKNLRIPRRKVDKVEATKGGSLLPEFSLSDEYEIGRLISVPILPFNLWATNNNINVDLYDLLIIDVQGMELDVLKGFGNFLNKMKYLVVECSELPVYQGEAFASDVVKYLRRKGFIQQTPILSHNDILFMRENV